MSCSNHRLPICEPPERVCPGLMALLEAYEYSEDTSGNCWEFAVELERLTDLGLTLNDFRWLVPNGLSEHQREVRVETDDGREFRSSGDLSFPERTCFILNAIGVEYARRCCGYLTQPEQDSKRRLSDTIKCLNRKQVNPVIHFRGDGTADDRPYHRPDARVNPVIHFRGDGTGEGVVWDIVDQHPADNPHAT